MSEITVETKPLWEILVPYKIGRRTVQVPYHQIWDKKVVDITGGLTLQKVSKGMWVSPTTDKTHSELMIPVRIACSKEQILEIMEFTITHYRQEAVFCTKISEETLIMYAATSEI